MIIKSLSVRRTLLGAGLAVASTAAVVAAPLDPEICRNLTTQRDELEARGVRQRVLAGPTAGLAPHQLSEVRLLMDLDGQLRFRCPFDQSLATLKEDPPEEGEVSASPTDTPATAVQPPKLKSVAKKKPVRVAPAPTKDGGSGVEKDISAAAAVSQDSTSAPAQKTLPRSRTGPAKKADDAFRPSSDGDRNGTPLNQQATQPK